MPHLVQMDKKYAPKGLVLIGAEVQGSSADAIAKVVKDKKVKHTITSGVQGPAKVRGIPHMLVFDTKGEQVYSGHPNQPDAEKAIKEAIKEAKPPAAPGNAEDIKKGTLVESRKWTSNDGRTLEAMLKSLDGDTGMFIRPNGKSFKLDISKLSEDDQKIIEQAKGE